MMSKSRRDFLGMLAGMVPAIALFSGAPDKKPRDRSLDGPFGSQFVTGDPYYETWEDAFWLTSANPVNPCRGDCFYHAGKGKTYVYDGHAWVWLKNPPNGSFGDQGPYRSEYRDIEWVIEDERVWITKIPWEYMRKSTTLRRNLTGLRWHGFNSNIRRGWSCDLTHANTVRLRYPVVNTYGD